MATWKRSHGLPQNARNLLRRLFEAYPLQQRQQLVRACENAIGRAFRDAQNGYPVAIQFHPDLIRAKCGIPQHRCCHETGIGECIGKVGCIEVEGDNSIVERNCGCVFRRLPAAVIQHFTRRVRTVRRRQAKVKSSRETVIHRLRRCSGPDQGDKYRSNRQHHGCSQTRHHLTQSPPAPPRRASRGCRPPRSRRRAWLRSCRRPRPCHRRRWHRHGPCGGPEGRCGPR